MRSAENLAVSLLSTELEHDRTPSEAEKSKQREEQNTNSALETTRIANREMKSRFEFERERDLTG